MDGVYPAAIVCTVRVWLVVVEREVLLVFVREVVRVNVVFVVEDRLVTVQSVVVSEAVFDSDDKRVSDAVLSSEVPVIVFGGIGGLLREDVPLLVVGNSTADVNPSVPVVEVITFLVDVVFFSTAVKVANIDVARSHGPESGTNIWSTLPATDSDSGETPPPASFRRIKSLLPTGIGAN